MNWRSIAAIVRKDATLFFRNRFFAVITVLGLIMGIVVYFIMPSTLEETLELGVYSPSLPPGFEELYEGEIGIQLLAAESEDGIHWGNPGGEFLLARRVSCRPDASLPCPSQSGRRRKRTAWRADSSVPVLPERFCFQAWLSRPIRNPPSLRRSRSIRNHDTSLRYCPSCC